MCFLILYLITIVENVEIVRDVGNVEHSKVFTGMEIADSKADDHRAHVINKMNEYNKRHRNREIERFVKTYEKKIEGDLAEKSKVEVIDPMIEVSSTIKAVTNSDPCETAVCHPQAVCISIGKI